MKSEKVKEFIDREVLFMDDSSKSCCYGYNAERDGIYYLEIDEVREAIELAEREAEERMRERAIKAFRRTCVCGESTCNSCALMKRFIQKLNEE